MTCNHEIRTIDTKIFASYCTEKSLFLLYKCQSILFIRNIVSLLWNHTKHKYSTHKKTEFPLLHQVNHVLTIEIKRVSQLATRCNYCKRILKSSISNLQWVCIYGDRFPVGGGGARSHRPARRPTQPPIHWVTGLFFGRTSGRVWRLPSTPI
jgi:hypothetical protein